MDHDFLKIVRDTKPLQSLVRNTSLKELYLLRMDSSFGTNHFQNENEDVANLSRDFYDASSFFQLCGNNPISKNTSSSYFHRTICAIKAIELWERYKRVYEIDKDWYEDFLNTESIVIDFSLLQSLPFDSFYIDLSNLGLPHTNHFENVIGVVVSVLDASKIHLAVVDNDNENYNPIYSYKGKLPSSWNKYDCGSTRFTDFLLTSKSNGNVLLYNKDNANDCFGWEVTVGGVVEGCDIHSPVINKVVRFVIPFLYFLHSKTEDIEEVEHRSSTTYKNEPSVEEVRKWEVGFRYGEKVRNVRKKCELYGNHIVGIERNRPRAYVRCAHWHNYWCGNKNNRHLEPRWIEPTYCNGTISDIVAMVSEVSDKDLKESNGEKVVAAYLDKIGVEYEKEKMVSIKGHNRRFDFEVVFGGRKMFIEFDGEQHFKLVEAFGGVDAFKERQRADFDKNKYAKQAKIPLLRIRYDQLTLVPSLIDTFFEHPSIHRLNPLMDNSKYYNTKF